MFNCFNTSIINNIYQIIAGQMRKRPEIRLDIIKLMQERNFLNHIFSPLFCWSKIKKFSNFISNKFSNISFRSKIFCSINSYSIRPIKRRFIVIVVGVYIIFPSILKSDSFSSREIMGKVNESYMLVPNAFYNDIISGVGVREHFIVNDIVILKHIKKDFNFTESISKFSGSSKKILVSQNSSSRHKDQQRK